MVSHAVVTRLHTIPHHVALLLYHPDVHHRLISLEETLHVVCLRLRVQFQVEHSLTPALCRPSLTLAQVVYSPPVSQSHDFLQVHLEKVLSHSSHRRLTLVEPHPGESTPVAREVHISVVVSLHIRHHSQVARQRVRLPVAVARMHGHRDQSCGVVALNQCAHQFKHRHAKIVKRLVSILLQFVAQAPHHHAGRVSVALDPLRHIRLPQRLKRHPSARMLTRPLVVELVDHQDTILVAQFDELPAVGVMTRADMIDAKLLHQLYAFLDGPRIGSRAQCAQRVVVGITLQQHLLAVEQQALVGRYLDGANAEALLHTIHRHPLLVVECSHDGVEVRMVRVPQLRIGYLHLGQLLFHDACRRRAAHLCPPLIDRLPLRVEDAQRYRHFLVASARSHLGSDGHKAVVARGDAQRVTLKIQVAVGAHQFHVAKQSATRVPARVARLARVGTHSHHVVLSHLQFLSHIYLEPHVAIVRASHLLAVHIDIAHIHDATEIQQQSAPPERVGRHQVQPVPSLPHLLEATTAQSALDIGRRVVVVGLFASRRRHPRLLYLEVVRHAHRAPSCVVQFHVRPVFHVASLEVPAVVQHGHAALRHSRLHTHSRQGQQSPKFSFHHFDLFVFSNCESTVGNPTAKIAKKMRFPRYLQSNLKYFHDSGRADVRYRFCTVPILLA